MHDSILTLLSYLPFPAFYMADPPVVSPSLARLLSPGDGELLFLDAGQVPSHVFLKESRYRILPSPEDPALLLLIPEPISAEEQFPLQSFLQELTTPLSNLVLMGPLLNRMELPDAIAPYVQRINRTTDQLSRLRYNAVSQNGVFSHTNLADRIRDTLGYASYYLPDLKLDFTVEGNGDPILILSPRHVDGLILNLISETLTLADHTEDLPHFHFILRLKKTPSLMVRVHAPSISHAEVEALLFDGSSPGNGFHFIRQSAALHNSTFFVRQEEGGFFFTVSFPRIDDIPPSVNSPVSNYSGYEGARVLLSNHLDLSVYENGK